MKFSSHNIYSRIAGSDNGFIVNLLTGAADLLAPEEYAQVEKYAATGEGNRDFIAELESKGYLLDEREEQQLYRAKYLDFMDSRETDEVQVFFVPNYSCNFACTYCYQDEYASQHAQLSYEVIDAFFAYVEKEFAGRSKYLTVFGGEPLLGSVKQKELITYFLYQANAMNLEVCFVTNGYTLPEYMDVLSGARIREVQVTLDGVGPVHDARRFLKGGGPTFEKVVAGIDACLAGEIPVNLRMVIDRDNISSLPDLARFAIDRGWTGHPLFKTQLGRNYELHHCQAAPNRLFSRIALYESIHSLITMHPHILEFYKPAFSVSKFLAENGELPGPLFDSCPACKTEWAFDYTGHIYSCTATVGKDGESLGTFFPAVVLNEQQINAWQDRDVTSINGCAKCTLQLACGGGCGSVAKNRTGNVCETDCRPVRELMELGFATYLEDRHET
jgi:uncharacterized protein